MDTFSIVTVEGDPLSSSNIEYNFEYTIGFQTALSMEGRLLATDMKSILYPCFCVVNPDGVVVT